MKTMLDPAIWNDPDFEEIEELETIAFYIYLMANEACNSIGMYKFSKRKAATDARLMPDQIKKHIEILSNLASPKIKYDPKTHWMWIIGSFKQNYRTIRNGSIAKNIIRQIDGLDDTNCPFVSAFNEKNEILVALVRDQCETVIGKGNCKGKSKENGTGKRYL